MIMIVATPPSPVHWTTYAALTVSVLSTIGTFVYVWFTYKIMKSAVDQGLSAATVSKLTVEDAQLQRAAMDDKVKDLLLEIHVMCAFAGVGGNYAYLADEILSVPRIEAFLSRLDEVIDMRVVQNLRTSLRLLKGKLGLIHDFRTSPNPGMRDLSGIRATFAREVTDLAREMLSTHYGVANAIPPVPQLPEGS
jgi:hypothetical protein